MCVWRSNSLKVARLAMRAWCFALALVLSGCAAGYKTLQSVQADTAWTVRTFTKSNAPSLAAFRAASEATELWVYIEGDGRSWITPRQISDDPTPQQPVALQLARHPQDAAVLYLGRPCQYLSLLDTACDQKLWSLERYGADAVTQLSGVIDHYRAIAPGQKLILVGYSGGGVLAALLARQRTDVAGVITLAANLSLAAWTDHHKITPLTGSIDPAANAEAISHIRQVHMVGAKDKIVPPEILQSFIRGVANSGNMTIIQEPQFTHDCCWVTEWGRLRAAAVAALKTQ